MKKRIITISLIIITITIIVAAVFYFISMFTKGKITGKLYRVDNVYEEIWNLVNSEKNGKQTILTTSIECSEIMYDFGQFQNINIPVNDECRVVLSFYHDEMLIWLFDDNQKNDKTIHYVYNYQTNTLYGNYEESALTHKFLSLYYSLIGNEGNFNSDNPGNYTYVYAEYPLSHE